MHSAAVTFTPETTRSVLNEACAAVGYDPAGASLMRLGENALYKLRSSPIVVRVGRSAQAAAKEVGVAQWLAAHHFPAVRLADISQPQLIGGVPVTFWQFIEESSEPVRTADLGALLRALHALPEPTDFTLPRFEPMPKVAERLANIGAALPEPDRRFLVEMKDRLEREFTTLTFSLGNGPIHGDYYSANLIRDKSGTVQLIDFEDFAIGPREWDACVESIRYHAFDWVTLAEYREFVRAYGFDPLKWSGFAVVRAVRELNMTTWLVQQAGQSAEVDREVERRITDLRNGQAPRHWRSF